jgi:hypothetical protein
MSTPFDSPRLSVHEASEASIDLKIQFLADVHLWPGRERLDPYAWLKNFTDSERPYALNLLNTFLYFNEELIDAMFRGAVSSLSSTLTASASSYAYARDAWRLFLANVLVTYVEGDPPRVADSGAVFARKARQILGIADERIVTPANALTMLLDQPSRTVLLVDDFVGSGRQMKATWTRQYLTRDGARGSFSAAFRKGASIIYVPLIATAHGIRVLAAECSGLRVCPAHVLDSKYSLTSADSILWPDSLKEKAPDVLRGASRRAGILGGCAVGWQGLDDLALPIAFSHSVPDATLPLYYWEHSGWSPLVRRA